MVLIGTLFMPLTKHVDSQALDMSTHFVQACLIHGFAYEHAGIGSSRTWSGCDFQKRVLQVLYVQSLQEELGVGSVSLLASLETAGLRLKARTYFWETPPFG